MNAKVRRQFVNDVLDLARKADRARVSSRGPNRGLTWLVIGMIMADGSLQTMQAGWGKTWRVRKKRLSREFAVIARSARRTCRLVRADLENSRALLKKA